MQFCRKSQWLKLAAASAALFLTSTLPAHAQMDPEAANRALVPMEGLEAKLFASEPMFANPCDMDVDSKGRVWVTEGWNYRASKLRPEGDRIVVMEDTDGDGKADKE